MTTDPPGMTVNGVVWPLAGTDPATTALDFLRAIGLTGAKEGCAEGECGACAVMVARPDGEGRSRWTAVNACLVPAAALDGQEVVTSEGLGTPDALHPVQEEMAVRGGSQCGYCTPGFVCAMAAEYYRPDRQETDQPAPGQPDPDRAADHECGPNGFDLHALSGNLCRCTGYRPIRDAAFALGRPDREDHLAARGERPAPAVPPTVLTGPSGTFHRPADLRAALALYADHPDAVLVAGSTDWGVEVNLRGARAPVAIAVDRLPELRGVSGTHDAIEIGAALSLSEVERELAGRVPLLDQLFPQFASRLIRNGATLGGNLGTASPIGDAAPALLALDAVLLLTSAGGDREVPLDQYFTGYRQTVRLPGELIRSVRIPLPLSPLTAFHKIAKRRFDDISSVAIGVALDVRDDVVVRARIGLGGVAATVLEGAPWTDDVVRAAAAVLSREGTPIDDHRASAAYRSAMLGTSLLRLRATGATPHEVTA